MSKNLYLDTHAVIWLAEGVSKKFSERGVKLLSTSQLLISPMVRLELSFLYDRKKYFQQPDITLKYLQEKTGLEVDHLGFEKIIGQAITIKWTRDVFDLFITAHSQFNNEKLLTKDRKILARYEKAIW